MLGGVMRVRRIVLTLGLVSLLAGWLASGAGPAPAQTPTPTPGATGSISGYVFHDVNANGLRDDGEPGLRRLVQLLQGNQLIAEEVTTNGSYSLEQIPAGQYELVVEFDDATGFCGDPAFPNFDPLLLGGCISIVRLPWHPTTPERVTVTAEGSPVVIDFGGQPADLLFVFGRAVLEDNYPPDGTPVRALVGGTECGSGFVSSERFGVPTYEMYVFGGKERPGCGLPGDDVYVEVGGLLALETFDYQPFSEVMFGLKGHDAVAMTRYAWYWVQESSDELPVEGTLVQAIVGGRVCGEATIETQLTAAGFSKLIVPATDALGSCGGTGRMVSFTIGGRVAMTSVPWQPGIQRIGLMLQAAAPTPAPSPTVPRQGPIELPRSGGSPDRRFEHPPQFLAIVVALALAARFGATLRRMDA
jgi:hypothetical protein